jgi:hypothetical protein
MKDELRKVINMALTLMSLMFLAIAIYQYFHGQTLDAIFTLLLALYFDFTILDTGDQEGGDE